MHKILFSMRLFVLGAILFFTQLQAQNYSNNSLFQNYTKLGELDKIRVLMAVEKQSLSQKELLNRLKNAHVLSTAERTVYMDMLKEISSHKATEFLKARTNLSSIQNTTSETGSMAKSTSSSQFVLTEQEYFLDADGFGYHDLYKYSYDNSLNMIQYMYQYFDSTAGWVNSSKMIYSYDSFNRDTLDVNQAWDSVSQSWVDYAKWLNTFNANNRISESLYFGWADPNWELGFRDSFTYDANNNVLEYLTTMWDSQSSTWVNSSRETFTYDTNNNLLTDIYGFWTGTAWQEGLKSEYTYDGNNNLISSIMSGQGNYIWQHIYTYDSNNNQLTDTSSDWDGTSWVIGFVQTNTYDAMNNLIHNLFQISNGSTLNDYSKYDATFNASNNITDWRSYTRDAKIWVPNSKGEYTYDADQNNTLYTNYGTRDGGETWRLYYFEKQTWSQVVTGIEEKENNLPADFSLAQNYPNPFNPSTKISFTIAERGDVSLKVFDLLGREVAKLVNGEIEAGSYEIEFNAANLPSGIYFYRMTAGIFSKTAKMMLLK